MTLRQCHFFHSLPIMPTRCRRYGLLLLALLSGHVSAVLVATIPTPARPNILLIVADDMGYSDLGCYGGEIDTPNLDRLARDGIRFTQFYNAARCSQSRAALLTGLYNHQTGLGETPDYNPRPPEYLRFLGPGTVTIAELLRSAGYQTLMSGKWHLGRDRPHWPIDRGFDHVFALIDCCSNYFGREAYHERPGGPKRRALFVENDTPFAPEDGFFTTDAFADRAVDLLEQHGRGEAPFFLYLAFTAPHWPLHAPPEDIRKYRGRFMEGWDKLRERRFARMRSLGILEPQWQLPARQPLIPAWDSVPPKEQAQWELMMAVYAAMVERMDQAIGRVLAKLDQTGQRDNTLVLFISDNGASGETPNAGQPGAPPGDRASYLGYGIPWANLSNTPWRLYKTTLHEGGISTPLIARWPDGISTPGRRHDGVGHVIDVMATVAEVAGASYPATIAGQPTIPLAGTSLVPALRVEGGETSRTLFWEHWGNYAVRDGRWKLVRRNPGDWELYNMVADRTETNDLATRYPDRVQQMDRQFHDWAKSHGAVVPYPFPAKKDDIRRPPF